MAKAVEKKLIDADGDVNELEFEYTPDRSSWVAIRVFPAAHTNPIFVEVDGAPIRASKRSAEWCLDGGGPVLGIEVAADSGERARGGAGGVRSCAGGVSADSGRGAGRCGVRENERSWREQ